MALDLNEIWNRPGFLVRRLNQIHHAIFYEVFGAEISPLQYGILTVLGEGKDSLAQGELGKLVGTDRATLASSLGPLETKGLIKVSKSPSDKRKKIICATLKGRRFVESSESSMKEAQLKFLEPIPASQRDTFLMLMRTLAQGHDDKMTVSLLHN